MSDAVGKFIDFMRSVDCGPHDAADVSGDDVRRYYRIAGDRAGVRKGSYVLRVDPDGFAVGGCMSMRDQIWHSWHSKSKRGASEEERAEWKARREAAELARVEADRQLRERASAVSSEMWGAAIEGRHDYLTRKGMTGEGLRVWTDLDRFEDWLLVPVYGASGALVGMQKIGADGDKLFVYGSELKGGRFWIGNSEGAGVVAICEGVATGDKIRQATGWPVCVAFNAGNLKEVARTLGVATGTRVVVCADNDLWTWAASARKHKPEVMPERDAPEWAEWSEKGWLENVGREAAQQAAAVLGGAQVLYPQAGGDWDDMWHTEGADAVRDALMGPLQVADQWEPDIGADWEDAPVGVGYDDATHPVDRVTAEIRPQGYIGKKYYFFPRSTGDIEEFGLSELSSDTTYFHLARESFWKQFLEDPVKMGGKEIVAMFKPQLMEMCKDAGKFDPERVLSTGVWPDGAGGVVANMGDRLYIPSRGFVDHSDYEADKVYISAPRSMNIDVVAMGNKEAVRLRDICESLSWRYRISGSLLAGWIYASILSGALRWRPHIFVTGGKGSGKTTVMRDIIKAVLKGWSRNSDGGTTEAGFRRKLGNQARPVVSDEMETETKKQRDNADGVLTLARQSSSGAEYANAYVDITVHSCFCFGGINPNIKHGADKDRITELELVKDRSDGFRERWKVKEREIKETFSGDYGRRLARRAIDNAAAFLSNVEVFEDELSVLLGDSRSAEQFAPMIAGLYGLHSTGRIAPEHAGEWVRKQDWEFFHQEEEGSDADKMVSHLLTAMADYTFLDKTVKVAVSDMLRMVQQDGTAAESARLSLGRYGIRLDGDWLLIANSKSRIGELMRDTSWTVPKNTLSRYAGAESVGTTRFAPGVVSRGIRIPVAGLLEDETAVELPFSAEDFE